MSTNLEQYRFKIHVSDEELTDLMNRVKAARLPEYNAPVG
jgi:hypothetical protein